MLFCKNIPNPMFAKGTPVYSDCGSAFIFRENKKICDSTNDERVTFEQYDPYSPEEVYKDLQRYNDDYNDD